jgi:aminoglycoside phosphotransferase family enzyme
MRRYDERLTLAARLERGELSEGQLRYVATTLVRFHRDATPAPGSGPADLAAERSFDRNLHELLASLDQRPDMDRALGLRRFAHAFITGHACTFNARAASGSTREGHGDLRAEHVLVDGAVEIVDCVEFDTEFADELAFLVLDLAMRGGERFGDFLVEAYRKAGGDPGPDSLIAFYGVYRALVRAKVACVRAAQLSPGSADHGHQRAQARELISLAERFAWRARTPIVIAVCGVPGSGKSHLATALAERSGLPHLSSDLTRKRLAGVATDERAPKMTYSADWNVRTYAELARLTRKALADRGGAIVDATFRHVADR